MNYICCARLKVVASSDEQLEQLAKLLKLSKENKKILSQITPFEHKDHVPASECFRTWYDALSKLRESKAISCALDDEFTIEDVSVRFTRFENQVFLYFLVATSHMPQNEKELNEQRNRLQMLFLKEYEERLDFDFHVTSKIVEFRELLRLQPIVALFPANKTLSVDIQQAYPNIMVGKNYQRYYRLSYADKQGRQLTASGASPFVREQASVVQLLVDVNISDGYEEQERSHFYNMIHTELVFFQRTQAMEQRLAPTYRRIDFLKDLVHLLEDHWIRIRTYFSIAPKFALFKGNRAAYLFFNLLEVNGQVLALQNSIISRMDREHSKMLERYERLHFNAIQDGTKEEQAFLKQTHEEVGRSFSAYHNNTDTLKNATERLNEGISQLRGDFDSNTNIMLQLLVFTLSIVLVIWGVITLGFDKGFSITGQSTLDIASLLVSVVFCLFVVFGLFWAGAKVFVNSATRIMRKSANRVIETSLENDGKLNDEVIKKVEQHLKQLDKNKLDKKNNDKEATYMHRINQLLEVLIMLLPAVSLRHLDVKRANEYLAKAKNSLGIEEK